MSEHVVGTPAQWLSARKALLDDEKEHSRRGDELARRRLRASSSPWRMCSFSASSSSLRADSHCSRVPIMCAGIGFSFRRRRGVTL